MGPPLSIMGLTFSRIVDDFGLAVMPLGGVGGVPLPLMRNWSRRAATLLQLLELEGGCCNGGGDGAGVVIVALCTSAVFTALNGAAMLLRLLFEMLRDGVGGGGGFTEGRAANGEPIRD